MVRYTIEWQKRKIDIIESINTSEVELDICKQRDLRFEGIDVYLDISE
jgi:hypothetical protein